MVRRLPVGVFIGVAEPRHPERRAVSKRSAEVRRKGPRRTAVLIASTIAAGSSPSRSPASAAWSAHPCAPRARGKEFRQLADGLRHIKRSDPRAGAIGRFLRAARRCHLADIVGSRDEACSQPIRSRHSNALLMKSSECPLSAKARSVSAASKASASAAGERPAAIPVSRVRSAASRWRTFVQRRSQRLSVGRFRSAFERRAFPSRRLPVTVRRHPARPVEQREIGVALA